jgi:hypothetical protein
VGREPTGRQERDMKVATGLTLAAVGAILAFAVHGHLAFFDPNAAGWVLMLAGIAGLFMPPGTQRRLRQRLILKDGKYGPAIEASDAQYSRHLMPAGLLVSDGEDVPIEGSTIEEHIVQE